VTPFPLFRGQLSPHTTSPFVFHFLLQSHSFGSTATATTYKIAAIIMPPVQHPQSLPSFSLTLSTDHYKTVLPNLSYPSRPNAHVPWSGPSAPLLFSKTTRPDMTNAASNTNLQVPITTNICFDTCSVPDAFQGINALFWHNLSMIIRKLKLIRQKLFGIKVTSPSVVSNV